MEGWKETKENKKTIETEKNYYIALFKKKKLKSASEIGLSCKGA